MDSYYNDIAEGYDELHRREQMQKLSAIWNVMETLGIEGKTLLDVGCGTGIASEFFAMKGFEVFGIDPAAKLLEKNKFPCVLSPAENIPLTNNSYDIVVSLTAIHNFKDIKKGLEEIKRVGKETFIFSVLRKSSFLEEIDLLLYELYAVSMVFDAEQDRVYICLRK